MEPKLQKTGSPLLTEFGEVATTSGSTTLLVYYSHVADKQCNELLTRKALIR